MNPEICLPREVLEAPFPEGQVKTRPGAFGGSLSYLEGHTVIGRLNDAFDGNWSFEIMSHQILEEEVLVCGKFRANAAGVIKMSFGSSRITRDSRTGNAIALGDDLKAASTDALKKSATLLGVGLSLYGGSGQPATTSPLDERPFDEELRTPSTRPRNGQSGSVSPQGSNGPNADGRITNKQIKAIFAIGRQKGMTNEEIRSHSRQIFQRNVDYLAKHEASQLIESLLDL
jgi:hypothetical protein